VRSARARARSSAKSRASSRRTLTDAGLLQLKNAERYITPELKSFEDNALSANERADALRYATANLRCPTAFLAGRTLISMS
jgi:hypothetical protein